MWAGKKAVRVFQFSIIIEKREHSQGLKNEPTAGFLTKKRHKKALYDKFEKVKLFIRHRGRITYFSNFLSFKNFEF